MQTAAGKSPEEIRRELEILLLETPLQAKILDAAGVQPQIRYSSRSYETVRSLVARGEGFSILNHIPQSPRTYDGGELIAIPIAGDIAPLDVCFVRVAEVRPTARARVIGTLARELFGGPTSPGTPPQQ